LGMVTSLPDLIQYFRDLAEKHVELKGFAHGPVSRIIAGSRSDNDYPLLWLETPTLGLLDKDGTAPFGQRSTAFVVLLSAPRDDYAAQDAAWARAEEIALDVLSYLRKAHKAHEIALSSLDNTQLEPVATLSVANEIGWRYEFSLGDYVSLSYGKARWK
jgi:hypothetical protein